MMPRPRFNKLAENKRLQILEMAAKEFAAHGFADASFNRILEQAGVSKGAAYYYFDDKADLFFTTVHHYAGQWIAEITQIDPRDLDHETFWEVLTNVYHQPYSRFYETPWAFGVFQAAQQLPPELIGADGLNGYINQLLAWLATIIKRGQTLGLVRTDLPDDLLFAVISGFDRASDEWLLRHWSALDRAEIDRIALQMAGMLRRLISP